MIKWLAHSIVCILFAMFLFAIGWLIGFGYPSYYEFFLFLMLGDILLSSGEDDKETN